MVYAPKSKDMEEEDIIKYLLNRLGEDLYYIAEQKSLPEDENSNLSKQSS